MKVIKTVGFLAALTSFGGGYVFYDMAIPRHNKINIPEKKKDEKRIQFDKKRDALIEMAKNFIESSLHETVSIRSYDGLKLVADYIPAEKETKDTIILVHGFRSCGVRDFGPMLKFYHNLGLNILLVDDRGHGRSEGEFICFGWQDHYDVMRWIDFLIGKLGQDAKIFLHGISMGSATVMMVSGEDLPKQVKGVIADCGYTSAMDQFKYMMKSRFNLPTFPFVDIARTYALQFAKYDFEDCDSIRALKKTKLPFLFIHGEKDTFVPTSMVYRNYAACASTNKTLKIIEGAEHAVSYIVNTKEYEESVTEFVDSLR